MTRIIEAEYEELFGVAALYERNGTVRVRRGSLAQMPTYIEDPQLWRHRIEERFEHWKVASTQHSQIDHSLTFYLEPIPATPAPQPDVQVAASRNLTLARLKAAVEDRRRQEVKDHEAAVEAAKSIASSTVRQGFLNGAQWQRLSRKGNWDGNPVINEAIHYYLERGSMNNPKGWDHVLRILKQAGADKAGGVRERICTEEEFREAIAVVTEWAEQDKPKTALQKLAEVEALAAALKAEGLASVVVGKLEAILNEETP